MNTTELNLVAVGMVVKVFGVKGHVVVQPMTDTPARFNRLRSVWMGRDTHHVTRMEIERAIIEARGVRLKFGGIEDRTAAETLRGHLLFVEESETIRLPKGRHFVHDILGMFVQEESGQQLGTVVDVLRYPANDVYVVRNGTQEIMIPAVKEFVRTIDERTRTITVRLIEGMSS